VRMQASHPEREGELARAHALILHGMVVPSPTDPATGQVLSSDAQTTYTVNGTCSCQAGQHGKGCKHLQAWKLYQYVAGKVSAPEPPTVPLPEAPASASVHLTIAGHDVLFTMRDHDEASLLARLQTVLEQYPVPTEPPRSSQGKDWCSIHHTRMKQTTKEGRSWFSHKVDGQWCKGR
jgi:hypothetical protein